MMSELKTEDVTASDLNAIVRLPLPDGVQRMECGPVVFGDDWPGMFVRGDRAMHMAMMMREAAVVLDTEGFVIDAMQMRGYADLMASCAA